MINPAALGRQAPEVFDREGCHDLALELERFGLVFAVPGYPVTHVLDIYAAWGLPLVWSVNEKNAVESAVGSSLIGVPTAVVIKHNGLGVALDSLANAVVHGIAAPLIVIVGDDVDSRGSTSFVDTRTIAAAAGMLSLSPSLEGDLHEVIDLAAIASVRTGAPVVVRVTGRLHDQCRQTRAADRVLPKALPVGHQPQHSHTLSKLSRRVRARALRDAARDEIQQVGLDVVTCSGIHGQLMIAVGDAPIPTIDGACTTRVRGDAPSKAVVQAARTHRQVVVVEEGDLFIESQLGKTIGRASGHLPRLGRVSPSMVLAALRGEVGLEPKLLQRPPDPPSTNIALFTAIARLKAEGVFVATDVGSSVALSYPPFEGADAALALGSSPSVAAGAARHGQSAIAVLGDFGLLHSGHLGLIEIAAASLHVVSIVLENGIQAKTGNQPLPATDFAEILGSRAVGRVVVWDADTFDADNLYKMLGDELALECPVVIRYRRI